MSGENVARVRQSLHAFNRRDRAAWIALRDRDLEVVPSGDWPEAGPFRGREAAWDFCRAWWWPPSRWRSPPYPSC